MFRGAMKPLPASRRPRLAQEEPCGFLAMAMPPYSGGPAAMMK